MSSWHGAGLGKKEHGSGESSPLCAHWGASALLLGWLCLLELGWRKAPCQEALCWVWDQSHFPGMPPHPAPPAHIAEDQGPKLRLEQLFLTSTGLFPTTPTFSFCLNPLPSRTGPTCGKFRIQFLETLPTKEPRLCTEGGHTGYPHLTPFNCRDLKAVVFQKRSCR